MMTTSVPAQPAATTTTVTSAVGRVEGTVVHDFTVKVEPIGGPQFVQDPPVRSTPTITTPVHRDSESSWLPWVLLTAVLLVGFGIWYKQKPAHIAPAVVQQPQVYRPPVWPSKECGDTLQSSCAIALSGGHVKLRGARAEQEAFYKCVPGTNLTDDCELLAATSMMAPVNISITRANGRSGPITHIQRP